MIGPLISVKNLNKTFTTPGSSLHVLKDITFDVYKGEMIALMGPSGVGKSTLLHILGALDRPTSGNVLYEGRDVFELGDDALAHFRSRSIGFVFQFHHLLPEFNMIENTMMPALIEGLEHKESSEKAKRILEDVGLSGRLPCGSGTVCAGAETGSFDPGELNLAFCLETSHESRCGTRTFSLPRPDTDGYRRMCYIWRGRPACPNHKETQIQPFLGCVLSF